MRSGSGLDAVALVEQRLELLPEVPADAPGPDGDVPPAVGRTQLAQVDVAGDPAALEQHVGRAEVAVAHDEVLVGRSRSPPARPGLPPGSDGRARRGSRRRRMSFVRTRSSTCASARARSKRKGHHSSPTASWNLRSPRPRARTSAGRSSRHSGWVASWPGQRLGQQDGGVPELLQRDDHRDREVGSGPDHALGLAAQGGVAGTAAGGDLGEAHRAVGPGEAPRGQVRDEPVGQCRLPARGDLVELGRWRRRVRRGRHAEQGRGSGGTGYRLGDTAGRMECASRTT